MSDLECSCRPLGEHVVNCWRYVCYQHKVMEEYRRLKKMYSKIRKSKVGNSEIFIPKKLYYYAITLTGHNDYTKIINSIEKSKMFNIDKLCYGKEQNDNDKQQGTYHIHILTKGSKFIDAKEIYTKNKQKRVDVKLLRNKANLVKWHKYIHKETKFGNCYDDQNKNVIVI